MADVSFTIAGRAYTLVCDPGEETRLSDMARRVDREAQALMSGGGQLSEARLFMMTALMLADKLDDAEQAPKATPVVEAASISAADADILEQVMDDASARLTALTPSRPEDEKAES